MNLSSGAVEGVAGEQGESVYKSSYNSKDCSHREYVVEVGNYVVSIMEDDVKGRVGKYDTCEAPYCKKENKSECSEYWSFSFN